MANTVEKHTKPTYYQPTYYRVDKYHFNDGDGENYNTHNTSVTYNYNANTKVNLVCVTHINADNHKIVSVYKQDCNIYTNHYKTIKLLFTIDMTFKAAIHANVNAFYICTTANPDVFVLFSIHQETMIREIYTVISVNDKIPTVIKTKQAVSKYINYSYIIPYGNVIYIVYYIFSLDLEYNKCFVSYMNMDNHIMSGKHKQITSKHLFKCSGYQFISHINSTTIRIQNVYVEQLHTIMTIYDICTHNNTYTQKIIKLQYTNLIHIINQFSLTKFDNANPYIGNYIQYDLKQGKNGISYPLLQYVTKTQRHTITILSAYTNNYLYSIKFISDDFVYIDWSTGEEWNAHIMGIDYVISKVTVLYKFNRAHYTLTPIFIVNDIPSCYAFLHMHIKYIQLAQNNTTHIIAMCNIQKISNAECDAIYSELYEYLPAELCDIVLSYYTHMPYNLCA